MLPRNFFRHCPACGIKLAQTPRDNALNCAVCGFRYFFNPAVAAAAIVADSAGRILCIRRAREPQRGKLAFPGGFIDIGEEAEAALRREIREEVGLEVEALEFLCSSPNSYHYREVTYPVLDLIFWGRTTRSELKLAWDEVESVLWAEPASIELGDLAFPSLQAGLSAFLARKNPASR